MDKDDDKYWRNKSILEHNNIEGCYSDNITCSLDMVGVTLHRNDEKETILDVSSMDDWIYKWHDEAVMVLAKTKLIYLLNWP